MHAIWVGKPQNLGKPNVVRTFFGSPEHPSNG